MNNLKKSVLAKINKENIRPKPKYWFIIKHFLLWIVVLFAIVLGGIAFSVMFVNLYDIHWDFAAKMGGRFMYILPYVWFALIALIVFTASKTFEKTKKGYRYKPWIIASVSILISIILGVALFKMETGENIEQNLREFIKPYARLQEMRDRAWYAPERGILSGQIIKIESEDIIILRDFTDKKWMMDIHNANIHPRVVLNIDSNIIASGTKTNSTFFKAEIVRPYKGNESQNFRRLR